MPDLNIMVKAAGIAVRAHTRRPPASASGRLHREKQASPLRTIGLAAGEISPHVDIMKHVSGAVGRGADELAHYYKNMHLTPSSIVGQAQLSHGAAARPSPVAAVSQVMAKKTPTQAINPNAVMAHASNTMPAQVIQGAVKGTVPGRAVGTSTLLDQLSRTSFDKLSMFRQLNKIAGIADRDYMGGAASSKVKSLSARHAIPGILGAIQGAEGVPNSPLVGAVAGAGGGIIGMDLGAEGGRRIGEALSSHPLAPTIGSLIGSVVGYRTGADIGVRGARIVAG